MWSKENEGLMQMTCCRRWWKRWVRLGCASSFYWWRTSFSNSC